MAAQNGPIKTILYVIVIVLLLCLVGLYLLFWAGKTTSSVRLDPNQTLRPTITQFHDHRVDRWS